MSEFDNATNEDTLHFQIRRSHFYAVLVPLAFLLGLALGYLTWGGDEKGEAPVVAATSQAASQSQAESSTDQEAQENDIATQIANIDRADIIIDEYDPVYGPDDAPITIVEFADFECPFCQRYFLETYPQLLENYPGLIRFVYKDLPLTSIHPDAFPASLAGMCALEQDAFWPFHDLLYGGSLGLGEDAYKQYASDLELDKEAFAKCLEDQRYSEMVEADMDYAQELRVNSTPTFFINGLQVPGAQPFVLFAEVIDHELANPQP